MAIHANILACRIPKDRGPWWATVHGVPKCHEHGGLMPEQLRAHTVYICQSQPPNSFHPPLPTLMPTTLFSMSVSLSLFLFCK